MSVSLWNGWRDNNLYLETHSFSKNLIKIELAKWIDFDSNSNLYVLKYEKINEVKRELFKLPYDNKLWSDI